MIKLYGDGINDDTTALQAMLNENTIVNLPTPYKEYLISKTLVLRSGQTLRLENGVKIKLADNSSCLMIRCDHSENVTLEGGIWDMNNTNQEPNPLWSGAYVAKHDDMDDRYLGVAMRFYNIKNLTIKNLTLKDPVTFGIQIAKTNQFTIDGITFDYNQGKLRVCRHHLY